MFDPDSLTQTTLGETTMLTRTKIHAGSQFAATFATLLAVTAPTLMAAPNPNNLLDQSDKARGGGLPGIEWTVTAKSREGGRTLEPQVLRVKAVPDASLVETQEPSRFRGNKLLEVGRNMWITKPGLSKPIPVSPRQRMTGLASNGDIAATNYANDYKATLDGEESIGGVQCYVLELKARDKRTTYDRVRYWVSKDRGLGVKAEFYSLSGKLLKSASFAYDQTIQHNGKTIPFISRMVIEDELQDARTELAYGSVEVKDISSSAFSLGQL